MELRSFAYIAGISLQMNHKKHLEKITVFTYNGTMQFCLCVIPALGLLLNSTHIGLEFSSLIPHECMTTVNIIHLWQIYGQNLLH